MKLASKALDGGICHLTYTHSDCEDIWPIYFSQMEKYFDSGMKHFVGIDRPSESLPKNTQAIIYDDALTYPQRLFNCLDSLDSYDYIFFDHEDMFLYATPDFNEMGKYYNCLKKGKFDYIRMIKGGDSKYKNVDNISTLFELDLRSNWIFSIQPSFWNRRKLMDVLGSNMKSNIWDLEVKSQSVVKKMKLKAAFSQREGIKRGLHHYDNDVYPYVATAIVKGKWNISEYLKELKPMLESYGIDINKRGYF